jgi:hypothetical protein
VRKVDVGGRNDDRIRTLLDSHDPIERVLLLLERLVMSNQRKEVVPVTSNEATTQRNHAGWIAVADAATCLAGVTMSAIWL